MDLTRQTQAQLKARQDEIFGALELLERWWNGDQEALTDPRLRALEDEYAAIEAELERRAPRGAWVATTGRGEGACEWLAFGSE